MTDRLFGVTNREITPEFALRVGVVTADRLWRRGQPPPVIGIGHDTRHGAEILARAAAVGLASAGAKVEFFGCVPGGALSLNIAKNELDGGLLISGGALDPDRIGLVPIAGDGSACSEDVLRDLEKRLRSFADRRRAVAGAEIGVVEEAFHPFEFYVSELVQQIDARRIKSRKYRVLIDPANGPGSLVAKELFEWVGCDVEMMNFDPGPVPDRPAECRAVNCGDAINRTAELGCDVGLCTDPSATRVLFITSKGIPVSEETTGAIFATGLLKRRDVCVMSVSSGAVIEEACRRIGASVESCAVGAPAVARTIKETRAAFGCEESGMYTFPQHRMWSDGLASGLHLLDLMARDGETLADLASGFPSVVKVRRRIPADEPAQAIGAVTDRMKGRLTEAGSRDVLTDGIKRIYRDSSWILIRASATEPVLRVLAEAPTAERAEALAAEGEAIVKEALR